MTAVAERARPGEIDDGNPSLDPTALGERDQRAAPGGSAPVRADGRVGVLVGVWVAITLIGVWVVISNIGPLTEERDQRELLGSYREEIVAASNQAFGLAGVEVPTTAPPRGAPVGIIDIEGIGLQQVVVEGTGPRETRMGPGHVLGTGGPGQPGNSVVVGRRSFYGGTFSSLGDVEEGDRILVTTVQGQTVYEVVHVGTHTIVSEDAIADEVVVEEASTPTTLDVVVTEPVEEEVVEGPGGEEEAIVLPEGTVTTEELYGPSADDRLTLITSASAVPWVSDDAVVVVATMDGVPFAPTPQGGRTGEEDGRSGDPEALAPFALALAAYVGAVVAAIWMHRRLSARSAYLLTAPVLLALTIVLAEQVTHLLPAWS